MKNTTTAETNRVDELGRPGYSASAAMSPENTTVRGRDRAADSDRYLGSRGESAGPVEGAALALGRLLFGGYFVYNGINHFQNRDMMAGYAESKGVPAAALAVQASGAMILLGGLSLLAGVRPKSGAALITGFLLGVTPVMHAFWKAQDDQERMSEMVNFTKNVALIGGAALVAAVPEPWPASPERALARRRSHSW